MPALGAGMDVGRIVAWHVKVGDEVHRGDIVALVETDKANIDVEVFEDGVVEELLVPAGERVPVGTPLALIGSGTGAAEPLPAEAGGAVVGGEALEPSAEQPRPLLLLRSRPNLPPRPLPGGAAPAPVAAEPASAAAAPAPVAAEPAPRPSLRVSLPTARATATTSTRSSPRRWSVDTPPRPGSTSRGCTAPVRGVSSPATTSSSRPTNAVAPWRRRRRLVPLRPSARGRTPCRARDPRRHRSGRQHHRPRRARGGTTGPPPAAPTAEAAPASTAAPAEASDPQPIGVPPSGAPPTAATSAPAREPMRRPQPRNVPSPCDRPSHARWSAPTARSRTTTSARPSTSRTPCVGSPSATPSVPDGAHPAGRAGPEGHGARAPRVPATSTATGSTDRSSPATASTSASPSTCVVAVCSHPRSAMPTSVRSTS
jgi:pyruvate dehydrogenase E2 component (dihydrolipoamide acetyltransferase)